MKRSYMPRKPYVWNKKPIGRLTTNNHSSFRVSKDTGSRKPLRVGRRTLEWRRVWRWLKPRLEAAGRVRCEFDFIPHECSLILDPCHSKKRREMNAPIDIYTVAIGCRTVHQILDERMTHKEMEIAVCRAILNHGGYILPEREAS